MEPVSYEPFFLRYKAHTLQEHRARTRENAKHECSLRDCCGCNCRHEVEMRSGAVAPDSRAARFCRPPPTPEQRAAATEAAAAAFFAGLGWYVAGACPSISFAFHAVSEAMSAEDFNTVWQWNIESRDSS